MSSVLQFYIQMKDMMSSGLVKIAKTGVSSFAQVEGAMKKVQQHSEQVKQKNDILGSSYDMLQRKAKELESTISSSTSISNIRAARQELSSLQRDMGKHSGRPGKEGGIMDLLPVAAIGYGAKELISGSLEQAATAENQKIAFKVLMGSEKEGGQLYGDIRKLADVTPFESTSLMRSGKMMLGFGEDKKKIMPDLNMLGNVAAGQDDPTQALLGLSHAYGEVIAEGKLMGKNTLEMINWGFNPLKEISLMTGKSMSELTEAERDGAITADMVRDAFAHATGEGGKFNNMMAQQAETLSGKWSTFMDLTHAKMRSLGEALSPLAKMFMGFASSILNNNAAMMGLTVVASALIFLLVKAALGVGEVRKAVQLLGLVVSGNPLTMWIAGIGLAIALIIPLMDSFTNKTEEANKALQEMSDLNKLSSNINQKASDVVAEKVARASHDLYLLRQTNPELLKNVAFIKEQKKAQEDLHNLSERFFGTINAGNAGTTAAAKAMNEYTEAIKNNALAIAAAESEKDIYQDAIKQELDIQKQAEDFKNKKSFGANSFEKSYVGQSEVTVAKWHTATDQEGAAKRWSDAEIKKVADAADKKLKYLRDKYTNTQVPIGEKADKTQGTAVGAETDSIGRSTVSGGPRVININGVKFMDKLEMHVTNLKEDLKDVEEVFENMFLRVLNSGATVQ